MQNVRPMNEHEILKSPCLRVAVLVVDKKAPCIGPNAIVPAKIKFSRRRGTACRFERFALAGLLIGGRGKPRCSCDALGRRPLFCKREKEK